MDKPQINFHDDEELIEKYLNNTFDFFDDYPKCLYLNPDEYVIYKNRKTKSLNDLKSSSK
jgi:hypothetical protein